MKGVTLHCVLYPKGKPAVAFDEPSGTAHPALEKPPVIFRVQRHGREEPDPAGNLPNLSDPPGSLPLDLLNSKAKLQSCSPLPKAGCFPLRHFPPSLQASPASLPAQVEGDTSSSSQALHTCSTGPLHQDQLGLLSAGWLPASQPLGKIDGQIQSTGCLF